MSTDYRALCAELVKAWDATADFDFNDFGHAAADIVTRARAALAQPEPVAPTDEKSVPLSPRVVTDSQTSSNLALWVRLAKSLDLLASAAAEHEVFSARLDDLAALAVWACDDRDYRDALEVQP
jgi:precorrin isomerase